MTCKPSIPRKKLKACQAELEALKAENAKLWQMLHPQFDMQAEIDDLREDQELLEWMIKKQAFATQTTAGWFVSYWCTSDRVWIETAEHDHWRDAIKDARSNDI